MMFYLDTTLLKSQTKNVYYGEMQGLMLTDFTVGNICTNI